MTTVSNPPSSKPYPEQARIFVGCHPYTSLRKAFEDGIKYDAVVEVLHDTIVWDGVRLLFSAVDTSKLDLNFRECHIHLDRRAMFGDAFKGRCKFDGCTIFAPGLKTINDIAGSGGHVLLISSLVEFTDFEDPNQAKRSYLSISGYERNGNQ